MLKSSDDLPLNTINSNHEFIEKKEEETETAKDRYNLVYLILFIHGIGVLMPWNMFITANEYFVNFKLNVKNEELKQEAHLYRMYFLSLMGVVSNVPSVVLNILNLFCQIDCLGSISRRILSAIVVITVFFILNFILAMVDSSTWPAQFFWLTMASVVIINMANGIYQNSLYGTAAMFPMKYTNAVLMGSNFSGLLTTLIAITSYLASPDIQTSAIYYFLAAIVTLLIAFNSYLALPSCAYYNAYKRKARLSAVKHETKDLKKYMQQFLVTFKLCWVQDFSVFFIFVVTLSCFPAITVSVEPLNPSFFVQGPMFGFITCFLVFNTFSILGCFTTEFVRKPGPRYIWVPVLLRLAFIPFFLLSNYKPSIRSMPVISNDYVYTFGVALLAYTHGYFSSLCMMYAPSRVESQLKGIAGMMAANFLVLGVFIGILMSFPLIFMIENIGKDSNLRFSNYTV